jgi:hypothetical protein
LTQIENRLVLSKNLWIGKPQQIRNPFRQNKQKALLYNTIPQIWKQIADILGTS